MPTDPEQTDDDDRAQQDDKADTPRTDVGHSDADSQAQRNTDDESPS